MFNDAQKAQFEEISRQMMEWLNANCHPHHTVVITCTTAELSEGCVAFTTTDYLRD